MTKLNTPISAEAGHVLHNNWFLFGTLLCLAFANIFVYQTGILTREVYTNLMSDRIDAGRIDDYYELMTRLSVWNYLVLPLFLLLRFCFVALLVQVPFILKYIDIPFTRILRVVMIASIPLFLGALIRTFWLLQLPGSEINHDTLTFVPFSFVHLFKGMHLPDDSSAFLSQFNIFELAWVILMTFGLARISRERKFDLALTVSAVWSIIVFFQWLLTQYLKKVNG